MKLTDTVHLLRHDFEILLSPEKKLARFVNTLIIFGDKIILIDTGTKGSEERIYDYIERNNRKFSEIGTILLSHSHPDHIGAAQAIKKLTNCKVYAHRRERGWIEDIDLQNRERPVPGFYTLVDRPVTVDGDLEDGQTIKAAKDITLRIIHAPGHSKGSLNIRFEDAGILFTADSIPLKNDIPNYDNFQDLMASLCAIKDSRRYTTLLTSWTLPMTTHEEFATILNEGEAYLLKIDKAVKEAYVGDEPQPLSFCRAVIGKLGLPPFLAGPLVDRAFRSHLVRVS